MSGMMSVQHHHSHRPSVDNLAPHASPAEMQRLEALRSYDVLDTPPEKVFDELARMAASIAGTPIALVTLIDEDRQWFKARIGLEAHQTPRNIAFCSRAIEGSGVFVVPDALQDERFADNPLVTSDPSIRFYAGAPLITPTGQALGTLCIIDHVPRKLSVEDAHALQILSRHVMAQLDLRRRLTEFTREHDGRREDIESLRHALAERQFLLHYQPKASLQDGRVTGVEALIRWNDPKTGMVPPDQFIPLLEKTGLILDVGRWVISQAVFDYQNWRNQKLAAPRIAVNVSPVQLRDPDFLAQVQPLLHAAEGETAGIDIEITEGVLMESIDESVEKLSALRKMGVRIAVDDFGTGYSSLRYLAKLPIDALKIDRSFVAAMAQSPNDMAIVTSIISLAHGLRLQVIAEGVENENQRQLLSLLQCDQMQGYLLSPPVPPDRIPELLR